MEKEKISLRKELRVCKERLHHVELVSRRLVTNLTGIGLGYGLITILFAKMIISKKGFLNMIVYNPTQPVTLYEAFKSATLLVALLMTSYVVGRFFMVLMEMLLVIITNVQFSITNRLEKPLLGENPTDRRKTLVSGIVITVLLIILGAVLWWGITSI